jgi:hypothetical protein
MGPGPGNLKSEIGKFKIDSPNEFGDRLGIPGEKRELCD